MPYVSLPVRGVGYFSIHQHIYVDGLSSGTITIKEMFGFV